MGTEAPRALFLSDRLGYPAGYPNASAAVFLMALWPALTLAAARRVPWPLRGVFAGGAVLLAELGLLTLSRGALFTAPVVVVVLFALVPNRLRHAAVLIVVGVAVAAAVPTLLHVSDVLGAPRADAAPAVDAAVRAMLLGALAAGAIVAVAGVLRAAAGPRHRAAPAPRRHDRGRARGRGDRDRRPDRDRQPRPSDLQRLGLVHPGLRPEQRRRPTRQRPGVQPLRLLPRRASTSSRTTRWPASAPTTTSSSTCASATATRRRTTRTASSCARSSRPGSSER